VSTEERRGKRLVAFRATAAERVARLNLAWIQHEQGAAGALAELKRELHSLKGEASLMGETRIAELAHVIEDLLAADGTVDGDRVLAELDGISAALAPAAATPETGPSTSGVTSTDSSTAALPRARLSVTTEQLERLRDVIGELLLQRSRLARTVSDLARARGEARELADQLAHGLTPARAAGLLADTLGGVESRLRDSSHQLGGLIDTLEQGTHDLRMTPIRELYEALPVQVRNFARTLGRDVRLTFVGEDVEVDRTVLSRLEGPVAHLLRNAIDHGSETAEARSAAGKPAESELRLVARLDRRSLVLEVADDGPGIDLDAARARGRELGLLAADADDADVLRCLFASGMSTKSQASQLSGRGIGLEAVQAAVTALGGTVEVRTQAGRGTTFVLTAPISMALSSVVLFRVGLGHYAVPSEAAIGVFDRASCPVFEGLDGPSVKIGEKRVRILALDQLLGEVARPVAHERVLVVQSGDVTVALTGTSDHVERDVVMKFSGFLERQALISAAAPIEDGALAWVLRVPALAPGRVVRMPAPARVRTILVVEDSPIVRDLVVEALRAHGHRVIEAADGEEGRAVLEKDDDIDLVLTDLEMPRLDGIGLLRWLRGRPGRRVPAIVLSMRGSDADKRRAVDAGADAYIIKSDFSHGGLLSTLQRFIT